MEECLAINEDLKEKPGVLSRDKLLDTIKGKVNLSKSEERVLTRLAGLSDKAFLIRFVLAWILYGVVFVAAGLLFYFIPEDRNILQFYLFAASGPLIMFTQRFSEYRALRWLNKLGIAVMVIVSISILRNWTSNHYTPYLLILVGMGPLMIILGTFYERRLLKIIERLAGK